MRIPGFAESFHQSSLFWIPLSWVHVTAGIKSIRHRRPLHSRSGRLQGFHEGVVQHGYPMDAAVASG